MYICTYVYVCIYIYIYVVMRVWLDRLSRYLADYKLSEGHDVWLCLKWLPDVLDDLRPRYEKVFLHWQMIGNNMKLQHQSETLVANRRRTRWSLSWLSWILTRGWIWMVFFPSQHIAMVSFPAEATVPRSQTRSQAASDISAGPRRARVVITCPPIF